MKANEPNFDDVQKALALKRHEQPSPRYFNAFSHEVIQRIHCPEAPRALTWAERWGLGEDARPFWLCGLGVLACAVLVGTLIASLRVDKPQERIPAGLGDPSVVGGSVSNQSKGQPLPGYEALPGENGEWRSTAPVLAPEEQITSFPSEPLPAVKKP